jgi:hypothetical protein
MFTFTPECNVPASFMSIRTATDSSEIRKEDVYIQPDFGKIKTMVFSAI